MNDPDEATDETPSIDVERLRKRLAKQAAELAVMQSTLIAAGAPPWLTQHLATAIEALSTARDEALKIYDN